MNNTTIAESTLPEGETVCGWCTTVLQITNHRFGSVCKKCYGLLTRAGVDHDEIFGDPPDYNGPLTT